MSSSAKVLLVDDETQVLESSRLALLTSGLREVITCSDSRDVLKLLDEQPIQVIVMDIMMPHFSGKDLLPLIKEKDPNLPIIMMTALGDIENIVECMRLGAFDYLNKPVENLRLFTSVQRAMEVYEVRCENSTLKYHLLSDELQHPTVFQDVITQSENMLQIFRYMESIASTSRAVLITGETGTGKELIAERIHRLSNLSGEYVTVNVAGLDDTLFSDVLFGHKKGAFTGADTHREGLLEKAEGGTIFLDEIGDLSMASQVKLLRLLQEREYYPLGSDNKKRTNARFVVATSREVRSMMADGSFRKDLYYRLQAHQIHLPALRERKGDIPMLLEAFAASAAKDCGKDTPKFPSSIVKILMDYSFAGNIRELEAMVFNAVSTHDLSHEFLQPESFLRDIQLASGEVFELKQYEEPSVLPWIDTESELPTIDECVDQLIELTLERCGHNQTATAKALGITRQGLLARLKRKKKE